MNFRDGLKQMKLYGGTRLLVEYCRMGLGWKIIKQVCFCIVKRKPLKSVYYDANRWVAAILLEKYDSLIKASIRKYNTLSLDHRRAEIVWSCWLQGEENMPDIVRACYKSQVQNIIDREFRFIDERNWRDYVSIPDYLVEKYQKGIMPASMFTDLIRLELLLKYGGSWIDSTVLCTGGYDESLLDADIFMFQYRKGRGVSNWFITSCTNNPILFVIRDVLHEYWKEYNVVVDYFIFHLLFCRLMPEYSEMIARMPYADSDSAISLVHNWNKPFSQKAWSNVTNDVHFHKLTWKVDDKVIKDKGNYYNYIVNHYR